MRSNPDNKPTDMEKAIADAVQDSLKTLHCTKREGKEEIDKPPNMLRHRVHVCIVCDTVIKGTKLISCMTKETEKVQILSGCGLN